MSYAHVLLSNLLT